MRLKRVYLWGVLLLIVIVAASVLPALATWQTSSVTAEAVGQANLRAYFDVASDLVGEIQVGTRYPIIGRSQFYPWYLLGDPSTQQPLGWVYGELVTVQGDLNTIPFSEAALNEPPPTMTLAAPPPDATEISLVGVAVAQAPVATPTLNASVIGTVLGEINIRYGPGVDFPRVGVARAGEAYPIVAYHTVLPWVQISYPSAPNGLGWVAVELLEISGEISSLPSITRTDFDLPTLTPTASMLQSSAMLGSTPVLLSPNFEALSNQLWNMILERGFQPETSTLGGLFLMDLRTGEAVSFGSDVAFSGMSISKIGILAATYDQLAGPPDAQEAMDIANMMVCSENTASNRLLERLGAGDAYAGAAEVSAFLGRLGLENTFMAAPFLIPNVTTPQPVAAPQTTVDQTSAEPDPWNQFTVDEMGLLLGSMYQCAYNESGPLISTSNFTPTECRQMMDVMRSNNLGEPLLFTASVPPNVQAAHKHGWIEDTHGAAGVIFSPGGEYVLVVVLHTPGFMDFSISFPLIMDINRTVYNYYNPTEPVTENRENNIVEVAACNLLGNPVIENLMSYDFNG